MNVENTLVLNDWAAAKLDYFKNGRKALEVEAMAAGDELGFKVTSGNLAAVLRKHGVDTKRRPKSSGKIAMLEAEVERLSAENQALRSIVAQIEASKMLSGPLRHLAFRELPALTRKAIFGE